MIKKYEAAVLTSVKWDFILFFVQAFIAQVYEVKQE